MNGLHVLFGVGGGEYAVPAAHVLQMESYEGATPLPNAAAHVAGVVQIRGQVMPVIDLRARFGLPRVERTLDTRVVVVEHEARVVALLVDKAREVARLDPAQVREPPPMVTSQSRGMVRAIAQVSGRMVMLVDLEMLLTEERSDGD
jgi:purine-binding chemotaxis protein CheW